MSTRSPVNAAARDRYLLQWRQAAKKPKKISGLKASLVELVDGRVDDLAPLADLREGSAEWDQALAEHQVRLAATQDAIDDVEDEADRLRQERAASMMALVMLGVTSAAVARMCHSRKFPAGVGPMVVSRAIGTTLPRPAG